MSGAPEAKLARLEEPAASGKQAAGEPEEAAGVAAQARPGKGAVLGGVAPAGGGGAAPAAVARETQRALEAVDTCQRELEALNERASEEILRVERRYGDLRRPHLERRSRLIEDIPGFWVTA
ncbi:hypothetical protein scyTo_0026303, partial [Scyliorhinus torazame]|nr:hypothetical protein [Scyliorhinus torazame]